MVRVSGGTRAWLRLSSAAKDDVTSGQHVTRTKVCDFVGLLSAATDNNTGDNRIKGITVNVLSARSQARVQYVAQGIRSDC